jgi:hypothetical protein
MLNLELPVMPTVDIALYAMQRTAFTTHSSVATVILARKQALARLRQTARLFGQVIGVSNRIYTRWWIR